MRSERIVITHGHLEAPNYERVKRQVNKAGEQSKKKKSVGAGRFG